MPTIDAHAHAFHRGLALTAARRYAPDYDAPLACYLAELDRNGLSHGLLVQPSFLGTDNAYLLQCLERAEGRLRGVAVVDPSIDRDDLLRLDRSGIVGVRLNLIDRPLPNLVPGGAWVRLIAMVGDLGWHVEVQRDAAGLARLVPQLLEAGLSVVLDHFGLPDPEAGAADPGFRELLALGRSERLWMKISAPYRTGAAGEELARALYPPLRDAFGLGRLMWGSDWPHTQYEATQSYESSRRFLDVLTDDPVASAAILASPASLFDLDRSPG